MRNRTLWIVVIVSLVVMAAGFVLRRGGAGPLSGFISAVHGAHRQ